MGWRALATRIDQLFLKLNIGKNKWMKNLPMSGENKVHKRHMKTPFKEKTIRPP